MKKCSLFPKLTLSVVLDSAQTYHRRYRPTSTQHPETGAIWFQNQTLHNTLTLRPGSLDGISIRPLIGCGTRVSQTNLDNTTSLGFIQQTARSAGVPQGSFIGPVLCNIYSNDIQTIYIFLHHCDILTRVIYSKLQNSLNNIEPWFTAWRVKASKRFKRLTHAINMPWLLFKEDIHRKGQVKYLGSSSIGN